jgi:hypothetical protein
MSRSKAIDAGATRCARFNNLSVLLFRKFDPVNTVFKKLWISTGFIAALAVGHLPVRASFETPSSGGASGGGYSYQVPLRLPKGPSGIVPQLGLSYSSQAGNGIAGVGWNLSGFSTITRCPQIPAIDGVRGSVNMDNADRLCLDGVRLLQADPGLVASNPAYLNANAVYFTEVFNGSRVQGPDANGLFTVHTKGGDTMIYEPIKVYNQPVSATTAPTRVEKEVSIPGGGTVLTKSSVKMCDTTPNTGGSTRLWALRRIEDSFGNYIEVKNCTSSDGEFMPVQVLYAGSPQNAPQTTVNFFYGEYGNDKVLEPPLAEVMRVDSNFAYMAGHLVRSTARLQRIEVNVAGTAVTEFKPEYEVSRTTARSRLIALQECSLVGSRTCLPPIRFTYAGEACEWAHALVPRGTVTAQCRPPNLLAVVRGTDSQPVSSGAKLFSGDFNGDGITDLLEFSTQYRVRLGNGSGTASSGVAGGTSWGTYTPAAGEVVKHYVGDFDGDGRSDVLRLSSNYNYGRFIPAVHATKLLRSTGSAFEEIAWTGNAWPALEPLHVGDFNGDGRTDFWVPSRGLYYGASQGFNLVQPSVVPGQGWADAPTVVGDFDGDGRADVAKVYSPGSDPQRIHVWRGTETGFTGAELWWPGVVGLTGEGQNFQVLDLNGDGKADIVSVFEYAGKTKFAVYISTGRPGEGVTPFNYGFTALGPDQVSPNDSDRSPWEGLNQFWYTGDYDGDGKQELIQVTNDGGAQRVWIWSLGSTQRFIKLHDERHAQMAWPPTEGWTLGDFNGDGRVDWIEARPGQSVFYGVLSATHTSANEHTTEARSVDDLIEVRTGLGRKTSVTYVSTAADANVYARTGSYCGNPSMPSGVIPPVPVSTAMFVVSKVEEENGKVGGKVTTDHTYGRAWSTLDGRGMRGFCWTRTTTSAGPNLPVTRTLAEMQLDWPHIGTPVQVRTWNGTNEGATPLKQVNTTLASRRMSGSNAPATVACTPSAQIPCLAYAESTEEITKDLGGNHLSRVRNLVTSVDGFGNPLGLNTLHLLADGSSTGYSKATTHQYVNTVSHAPPVKWFLARLERSQVQSFSPNVTGIFNPGASGQPPSAPGGSGTSFLPAILLLLM